MESMERMQHEAKVSLSNGLLYNNIIIIIRLEVVTTIIYTTVTHLSCEVASELVDVYADMEYICLCIT